MSTLPSEKEGRNEPPYLTDSEIEQNRYMAELEEINNQLRERISQLESEILKLQNYSIAKALDYYCMEQDYKMQLTIDRDKIAELQLVNLRLKSHAEAMALAIENYYEISRPYDAVELFRKDFPKPTHTDSI